MSRRYVKLRSLNYKLSRMSVSAHLHMPIFQPIPHFISQKVFVNVSPQDFCHVVPSELFVSICLSVGLSCQPHTSGTERLSPHLSLCQSSKVNMSFRLSQLRSSGQSRGNCIPVLLEISVTLSLPVYHYFVSVKFTVLLLSACFCQSSFGEESHVMPTCSIEPFLSPVNFSLSLVSSALCLSLP